MPPALIAAIPAVIGAGTALYAGSQQKKAAGKALDAQTVANDRALAEQAAARQQITQLQQPFVGTGYAALDALSRQFGLSQPQGQAPAAQPQQAAGPDYAAYVQANPDLVAAQQQSGMSPEQFGQQHYQQHGQSEGRQLPQAQAPAPQPEAAKPAGGFAGTSPQQPGAPDLMNAARPTAQPAPTFERPADLPPPSFERPTDAARPTYGDAPKFNFDPSQLENDKGYQFQLAETLDAANSGFAARGMLKSGAAAKGIMDRANGLAATSINDIFNRQLQQYNTSRNAFDTDRGFTEDSYRYGQNRADNIFTGDRSNAQNMWQVQQGRQDQNFGEDRAAGTDAYRYDTGRTDANFNADRANANNRYDTLTGNIFNLAQMGQNAAGATGAAGSTYANNAGNIFGSQANAAADAATSRGQANAGMVGAVGGAVASGINAYGRTPFNAVGTETIARANPFQLPAGTSRIPNVVF